MGKRTFTEEQRKELSEKMKKQLQDPAFNEKRLAGIRSAKAKENMSKAQQKRFSNPKEIENLKIAQSKSLEEHPERREHISKSLKTKYANDELAREKCIENLNKNRQTKEERSRTQKELWQIPEYKKKMCESSQKRWSNNEYRKQFAENQRKVLSNPEIKSKISNSIKKLHKNPEYRERYINGFRNAMRSNGSSIEKKVAKQLEDIGYEIITQKHFQDDKNGKLYYSDIFIPELNLIIECNGEYWHRLPERIERDKNFKEFDEENGYKIIFVWENDINKTDFDIMDYIKRSKK